MRGIEQGNNKSRIDRNAAHEQAAVDNRLAVEEGKHAKQALEGQWRLAGGLKAYIDHV